MKTISAAETVLYKFVFPAAGGVWALWWAVSLVVDGGARTATYGWDGVALVALIVGLLTLHTRSLKRVRLTEDHILVSNYRREIAIPLRDVASARQMNLPVPPVVEIRLTGNSAFGEKIRFIPDDSTRYLGWLAGDGAVVKELRTAMAAAWETDSQHHPRAFPSAIVR